MLGIGMRRRATVRIGRPAHGVPCCVLSLRSPPSPLGSASLYQTAWRGGGCCGAVTHLLLAPPPPFSEKPCCVFASQLLENSVHSCVVFAG